MRFTPSKHLFAIFALVAVAAELLWFSHHQLLHPEFGRVSRTWMVEHPGVFEQARFSLRRRLGLPTADWIWLLRIGNAPLQWSTGGGRNKGYIYMNHPLLDDTPFLEFALIDRDRLREVCRSDLPSDFYGMNDPRGGSAFGADWKGHAMRVPDGQVFLARVVTNRSVVYAIQLGEQGLRNSRGWMQVDYVTIPNPPANQPGAAPMRVVKGR
jgi:hypothetical protein